MSGKDHLNCFILKLKNVKKSLKGWGCNLRGGQIRRKKEILAVLQDLEIMEEMQFLDNEQMGSRAELQQELLELYEEEEL